MAHHILGQSRTQTILFPEVLDNFRYSESFSHNDLLVEKNPQPLTTEDKGVLKLVNAAIVMAHALKLKVVAQGNETLAQLASIKQLNCDSAQGSPALD